VTGSIAGTELGRFVDWLRTARGRDFA